MFCQQADISLSQVAHNLGINANILGRWCKRFNEPNRATFPEQGNTRDQEIAHLKRELQQVKNERVNRRKYVTRAEARVDISEFIERFYKQRTKRQCDIHAYVLMTNHVHLLVTPHTKEGNSPTGNYFVHVFLI